jgi:hypothetical protein
MAENVNVPGVGNVDRKWVIAGLGGVAAVVVYAYWRRSQAVEEEPLGEGETYAGDEWSPDAYIGADTPGGQTYTPEIQDDTVNTNAEWAQRVVDLLEGVGYDRNVAAATIGKYLAGQPLTTTEKILVQAAIGLLGNPPGGAIPIFSLPTPTPTPTPTTTKLSRPTLRIGAGLRSNTIYQLACNKVPGAIYYEWQRSSGPGAPTSVRTIGPARKTPSLKRGSRYTYRVRAIAPPGKTSSDWSNSVSFTVPKR